ncbi:MAG: hypothetical protein QM754_08045 [Tepidisphaeraceae bacterium]
MQFLGLLLAFPTLILGAGAQHFTEPVGRLIILLHRCEGGEDLLIQFEFGHTIAGMTVGDAGDGAAIVDVPLACGGFRDLFAGDKVPTVAATDQTAGIGEVGVLVRRLAAEQTLDPIPGPAIDERLVSARMPLALVFDFADVSPIEQDVVNTGPRELGPLVAEHTSLGMQGGTQRINRVQARGEYREDAPDVVGVGRFEFDGASTGDADIAIAVGAAVDEPTVIDTTLMAFAYINALLVGIERGHAGQRPPHHPAGGIGLHRLRHGDEGNAVVVFQPFEFDIVKKIAGRPVDFIEQHAVEFGGILLRISEQFFERRSFGGLRRGFGDTKEFDHHAARLRGVLFKGVFLYGKAEALTLLFPAANPGERNELFAHDDGLSRSRSRRGHFTGHAPIALA